jgi:hypothetical protein
VRRRRLAVDLSGKRGASVEADHGAMRVSAGHIAQEKIGGRDKDRTCDPYDVNVVLYR